MVLSIILHVVNERVYILGIPVDVVTLADACDRIFGFLKAEGRHHVMTPNPEMLVESSRNPIFKDVLMTSSLNVPDGAGLLWASRGKLPARVTGIDLLSALCADPRCPSVFLLGAAPGVAERAGAALRDINPSLIVAGTYSGSPSVADEEGIIRRINESGASILFVAYGAPKQDLWIARNLPKLHSVRVAMGIGGALDFLAGVRKRAPSFMRSMHLEWLWRLIQEPRRFVRIFTAVVIFPLLVFSSPQTQARL